MAEEDRLLVLDSVRAGYGKKQVLSGVTFDVASGEIVALIGHNGAGKSTTLKTVFGMLPIWSGSVVFDGESLIGLSPRDVLSAGVRYIPQGNRVFTQLTVRDNLEMGGVTILDRARLKEGMERAFALFPDLKSKLQQTAGSLSGGEKQMLALANALILSPRLLLLDEPSLGLAPPLVGKTLQHIKQISLNTGMAILIVEQKVREVLKIAQRVCILRNGSVSYSGTTESLQDEEKLRRLYV